MLAGYMRVSMTGNRQVMDLEHSRHAQQAVTTAA